MKQYTGEYYFDQEMLIAWVHKRGLAANADVVITMNERNGTRPMPISKAVSQRRKIYHHINEGQIPKGKHRLSIADIRVVKNLLLDFEYPEDPGKAVDVADLLLPELIKRGIAEEGQDVDMSGAGCHIILGIPPIYCQDAEEAQKVNAAWHLVRNHIITPIFLKCCREVGVVMQSDPCDIAKLCAPAGTMRFPNPNKPDCVELQQGVLRYTIGGDGERHESPALRAMILRYKNQPPRTTQELKQQQFTRDYPMADRIYQMYFDDARRYYEGKQIKERVIEQLGRASQSDCFVRVVFHLAGCFGKEIALRCAEMVNELVERPFRTAEEAVRQAQKALQHHKRLQTWDRSIVLPPDPRKRRVIADDDERAAFGQWVGQFIQHRDENKVPQRVVYEFYASWCQHQHVPCLSDIVFFRLMKEQGYATSSMYLQKQKMRCYMDIGLVPQVMQPVANTQKETTNLPDSAAPETQYPSSFQIV